MAKIVHSETTKSFVQGACCAIASIVAVEGPGSLTKDALLAIGIDSVKEMREFEVCDYDVQILKDLTREIQADRRRRKKAKKGTSPKGRHA